MHQVENYDLIISRDPDQDDREVLLLAVEASDLPDDLEASLAAKWLDDGNERVIDILFKTAIGIQDSVRFPRVPEELAQRLSAFDQVMLVLMGEDGPMREEILPLAA